MTPSRLSAQGTSQVVAVVGVPEVGLYDIRHHLIIILQLSRMSHYALKTGKALLDLGNFSNPKTFNIQSLTNDRIDLSLTNDQIKRQRSKQKTRLTYLAGLRHIKDDSAGYSDTNTRRNAVIYDLAKIEQFAKLHELHELH